MAAVRQFPTLGRAVLVATIFVGLAGAPGFAADVTTPFAGKAVNGVKDADSPKALRQLMRRDGVVVTECAPSKAGVGKAAANAGKKGLSREVGRHGITVNCVPPGRIISEQILRNYSPEFRRKESEEDIPVGEYGQPEDLANLVGFLASPLARYITGAVIPVDGGLRRYQF